MATLSISPGDAVPETLQRSLAELLRQRLESTGISDIDIHPQFNHADEPSVLVRVRHRLVDQPIRLKDVIEADTAARDLAWEQGERRFVYIDHIYDEKQKVADAR
ncbi:MAG TPA: hypothetical protein VK741_12830 [Acetobacteraceae bacterium]|jgi:hypothetical protein|nr:hypothetical protein [Acetobacteraceae bacterium]